MHDIITLLQLGEINVQQRSRRQRMGRFEPAGTLNLVAAEDLGIGDDYQLALIVKEAAG